MYYCMYVYSMTNGNRKYLKWATQIVVIRNQFIEIVIVSLVVLLIGFLSTYGIYSKNKNALNWMLGFGQAPTNSHAKVASVA